MMKTVTAFAAALMAAATYLGLAAEASAGCRNCGPIRPTYVYKTVNKVSHRTVVRNMTKTRYVMRTHKIVHVKRIQPIVKVHHVTRVHHQTVARVRNVHISSTQVLPARFYHTSSVRHTYSGCGCY